MHDELARENERLRNLLQLHAGDVMSLTNELDEWRDRALVAEEALAAATMVTPSTLTVGK